VALASGIFFYAAPSPSGSVSQTEMTPAVFVSYSLVLRNKPKINRNIFWFGLFRFEPKLFFDCFEDTQNAHDTRALFLKDEQ
jgi:hypothetical protein